DAISLARRLRNTLRGLLVHQLIADAPDRLDAANAAGELVAQPGHVNVDRPGIAEIVEAPDEIQQALAVEHHPDVLDEGEEQVELLSAKHHLSIANGDLASPRVDPQVA